MRSLFYAKQRSGNNLNTQEVFLYISSFNCPVCIAWMFFVIRSSGQSHHLSSSRVAAVSPEYRFLIGFAGTPPAIVYGGTSFVTTARLPIMAPSPIVTPAITTASYPIHTSFPMTISPLLSQEAPTFPFSSPHSSKKRGNG